MRLLLLLFSQCLDREVSGHKRENSPSLRLNYVHGISACALTPNPATPTDGVPQKLACSRHATLECALQHSGDASQVNK